MEKRSLTRIKKEKVIKKLIGREVPHEKGKKSDGLRSRSQQR